MCIRLNIYSFITACFILFSNVLFSQEKKEADDDYVIENPLRYEDWVYVPNIKSVVLHEASFALSSPMIDFDNGQQLHLSFDDLDGDYKNYYYTLVHCNAYWQPSDLMAQEYLSNYLEEQIQTYTLSTGTTQKYTHYDWFFPNGNIKINKTGNYLLKVYVYGNKDKPVFTRRIMVYSNKISVTANIHQAAGADDYMNKQEIDFSILNPGYNIPNPLVDMKVIIQQNNRWDNAIYDIKPAYIKPNEFSYDYDDGTNTFDGGNEYRALSFKNFKNIVQNNDRIYRDSVLNWHVVQQPEQVKTFNRYVQVPDIDGRFLITVEDRDSSLIDISAEYAYVHFFMPFDFPMDEGDFYILGNMCSNHFTKENRLTYNYFKKGYEGRLYLKQGYYNYLLVFLPDGKQAAEQTLAEGNHWETENEYSIYVYYKQMGTYYDQLICAQKFNSVRK